MFGHPSAPAPPPPPPPPPNPPTYASAAFNPPSTAGTSGAGGLFTGAAMSANPLGPPDQGAVQRKQLFGA